MRRLVDGGATDHASDAGRELAALEQLLGSTADSVLAAVASALQGAQDAEAILEIAVHTARDAGCTWQQIGDVMGITRQAAFQRFGRPKDPRTGREMKRPDPQAAKRAMSILTAFLAGDWTTVGAAFTAQMRVEMPPERMGEALAQVVGAFGEVERLGRPAVHQRGDITVVDVPVEFEAGSLKGRISFDSDGAVAGLFLVNPVVP